MKSRLVVKTAAAAFVVAGVSLGGVRVLDRPAAPAEAVAPPEHRRGTEQSFLTYPEWFLVFSPAEYAAFVQHHPPSEFPFWGHIRQYWHGYRAIAGAASNGYPPNPGYHVMIWVIGSSTTVEYGCRSIYETLVGRLSQLTVSGGETPEDRLASDVAQEYVNFIRIRPFYEFNFARGLVRLWRNTPLSGPNRLRKWERRYALTTEYAAKAGYGWFIEKATHASYDAESTVTAIVIDRMPERIPSLEQFQVLKTLDRGRILATVPRYQAFTRYARALAQQDISFEEIAGNRTVILVSVVAPGCWRSSGPGLEGVLVLFTEPILTQPDRHRVALVVPVPRLAAALRALDQPDVEIEHVYDY